MIHHTASPPSADGWDDVNYCTFHDDDAPLCNLYLGRSGQVWVCAAGATNTNGSGRDPCGVTPDDSMNSHAIGIEAGNDGKGETWPDAQLDAYTRLATALCDHYGFGVGRIHGHAEWAPDRKVDPAGPPRYATGSATWDMDEFRADCDGAPVPLPPPDTEDDDDMARYLIQHADGGWYVTDMATYRTHCDDMDAGYALVGMFHVLGWQGGPYVLGPEFREYVEQLPVT